MTSLEMILAQLRQLPGHPGRTSRHGISHCRTTMADGRQVTLEHVHDTVERWRMFQVALAYIVLAQAEKQCAERGGRRTCRPLVEVLRLAMKTVDHASLVPIGTYLLELVFRHSAHIDTGTHHLQYQDVMRKMDQLQLRLPRTAGDKPSSIQHLYEKLMDLVEIYTLVQPDHPLGAVVIFDKFKAPAQSTH